MLNSCLSFIHSFILEIYIAPLQDTTTQRRLQTSHGQRRVGYAMSMLSDLVACDSSRNARVALPEDMQLPIICTSIIPSIYILAPQLYCFIISVQSQAALVMLSIAAAPKMLLVIPLFHYLRI